MKALFLRINDLLKGRRTVISSLVLGFIGLLQLNGILDQQIAESLASIFTAAGIIFLRIADK